MKKIRSIVYIISLGLLGGLLFSCQKEDPIHIDDARINFWVLQDTVVNTGSKLYSFGYTFAAKADSKMIDTVYIRVRCMGPLSNADRHFKAVAGKGTDAVLHTDYMVLDGVIAANKYIGYLPVVLNRTSALKTTTKNLVLKIQENGEFKPGVIEDQQFTLYFNDGLVQPSNWNILSSYFGTYSMKKYQFIIQVLGRTEFPVSTTTYRAGQLTHYQMLDLKNLVKDALTVYNNSHAEPLKDEFDAFITIP